MGTGIGLPHDGLAEVIEWLDSVRRQKIAARLVAEASGTVAAGLALHAAAVCVSPWTTPLWTSWKLPISLEAFVVLAAVVVGLCRVVAYMRTGRPTLLHVAREIDQRHGMLDRLSTAVELSAKAGPDTSSVLARALILDVERRMQVHMTEPAERVRPRQSLRTTFRLAAVAVVLYALSLVANTAGVVNSLPDAMGETTPATVTPAAVESLRRAATAVTERADQTNDSYLQAVGRSLEGLADELERSGIGLSEATSRLVDILQHLDRALGRSSGPSLESTSNHPSAATEDAWARLESAALFSQNPTVVGSDEGIGSETLALDNEMASDSDSRAVPPPPELSFLSVQGDEGAIPGEGLTTSFELASELLASRDAIFTGYGDAMDLVALERELEAAARARANMPDREGLGAAGGGGEDASEQAGAGSHDGDGAGDWERPENAPDDITMELAGEVRDGRRITVDIPPEAMYSEVGSITTDGLTWIRQGEEPVIGEMVSPRYRDAVRDYFLALIELNE